MIGLLSFVLLISILLFCSVLSYKIISSSHNRWGLIASIPSTFFCLSMAWLYIALWNQSGEKIEKYKHTISLAQVMNQTTIVLQLILKELLILGVLMALFYYIAKHSGANDSSDKPEGSESNAQES